MVSSDGQPEPRKIWTSQRIIEFAQWWYKQFGSLAAIDWNPAQARALGHKERVKRFLEYGAPYMSSVQKRFGSWEEMKRQAGIPTSTVGYEAIGLHSDAPKRLGSWRETTPDGGWNPDLILAKEREWEECFRVEPRSTDWSPAKFKRYSRAAEMRARYEEVNPPTDETVRKYFGSFEAMLKEARKEKRGR